MVDEPSEQSVIGPNRKKACTECRQQKAKCDRYLDPDEPCSRCRKMKTRCVISAPFKRENKRQRLSELEKEADALRKRLRTEDGQSSVTVVSDDVAGDVAAPSGPNTLIDETDSMFQARGLFAGPGSMLSQPTTGTQDDQMPTSTVSRILDGVQVLATDIDNIFKLFFRDYSPWLPILDKRLSPNSCYQQSPFLFWAIIGTGCRRYSQNPTLLSALTQSIANMALLSITSSRSPLQRIQAFLLLVTWPLLDPPFESNQQEVTFIFAGLLLQLALRAGLHVPKGSEEFFRAKHPNLPDMGTVGRSELWTQCVLAYQRVCLCKGFLARTSFEISPETEQFQAQQHVIPATLNLRLKWQNLCVRCGAAVIENGVRNLTPDQDRALSIIIRTHEMQLKEIEFQAETDSDRLECKIGKLYIQNFYFHKEDPNSFSESFDKIQKSSRQVIAEVEKLVQRSQNPASTPYHISCALLFAAYGLLRILKSPIALASGEKDEATTSLFLAINLMKQLSVDAQEMCSKSVIALTQLWNSSKAFKKPDGSHMLTLRARSRLNGSHVVDSILWWRKEFDEEYRRLHKQASENASNGHTIVPEGTSQPEPPSSSINGQQWMDFTNDTSFFDFDYLMEDLSLPQDLSYFPTVDSGTLDHHTPN